MISKYLLLIVFAVSGIAILVGMGHYSQNIYCSIQKADAQCSTVYYPQQYRYDGILQLYQHKPSGAIWNLEAEPNLNACPVNSNCKVEPVGGGWYTDVGAQNNIRNEVPAIPGYLNYKPAVHLGGLGPYDQNVWRAAGYMDTPKDWKNIEISALFYLPPGGKDSASFGPAGIDYVLRGGVNENNFPFTCLAQNYHVGIFTSDQNAKIERDIEHTAGYNAGQITGDKLNPNGVPPLPIGKVFGFKVVIYNNQANTAVRIDAYLDQTGSGSNWSLIYSFVDDGHSIIDSVRGQTHCPGLRPDLPVTFGGPLSGLRLNWSHAFFRQLTIQEIEAPRF